MKNNITSHEVKITNEELISALPFEGKDVKLLEIRYIFLNTQHWRLFTVLEIEGFRLFLEVVTVDWQLIRDWYKEKENTIYYENARLTALGIIIRSNIKKIEEFIVFIDEQ